jgi:hypothetical protein
MSEHPDSDERNKQASGRPDRNDTDPDRRDGQEDVPSRPNVGTVTPEDYPEADRADSTP